MHVKKEGRNKECVIIEEMWHHIAIPTAVSHLVRGRKCSPTVSHWILASQFNASNITVEHIYLKYNKEIKQWCTANAHVGPIKYRDINNTNMKSSKNMKQVGLVAIGNCLVKEWLRLSLTALNAGVNALYV